jgi:3-isopropylmalate dehydratase small subunit
MDWTRRGRAWVYGDHLCGDDLIGGPEVVNQDVYDAEYLGTKLLAEVDPRFQREARPGDILVAGVNFGFSKAHQQFYLALKGFGIGGVVAASFQPFLVRSMPFYGIPFLTCSDAARQIHTGDEIEVDFRSGRIRVPSRGATLEGTGVPDVLVDTYEAGDQLSYLRSKLVESDGRA